MQLPTHNPLTSWAPLATFDRPEDARRAQELLQSRGIETQLHDERWVQRLCFFVSPQAGVHLRVLKEHLVTARQYLDAEEISDFAEVRGKMIRCPACHSSNIQFPETTRKNILPVIIAQILFLLRFKEPEYYCKSCHHTWAAPGRAESGVLKGAN
jgi:hypothetical protein